MIEFDWYGSTSRGDPDGYKVSARQRFSGISTEGVPPPRLISIHGGLICGQTEPLAKEGY